MMEKGVYDSCLLGLRALTHVLPETVKLKGKIIWERVYRNVNVYMVDS